MKLPYYAGAAKEPPDYRDAQVKELLGIPAHVETAALIPLGYSRGKFAQVLRKPVSDVAYSDRWGQALR